MPEIVALIERLIAGGLAYEADGDVYFAVEALRRRTATLSGQRPDEMLAEGRVEPGEGKRSPLDFALWKADKPDEDAWWDSPWGRGPARLAHRVLGDGDGAPRRGVRRARRRARPDLPAPRERARAVRGRDAASRSRGTGCTTACSGSAARRCRSRSATSSGCADALDDWGAETLLLLFARAHYRSPMDYNDDTLDQARAAGEGLREALAARCATAAGDGAATRDRGRGRTAGRPRSTPRSTTTSRRRQALAELFGLAGARTRRDRPQAAVQPRRGGGRRRAAVAARRARAGRGTGVRRRGAGRGRRALAEERQAARAARDFARADALRDQIAAAGFVVRDAGDGFELVPRTRGSDGRPRSTAATRCARRSGAAGACARCW